MKMKQVELKIGKMILQIDKFKKLFKKIFLFVFIFGALACSIYMPSFKGYSTLQMQYITNGNNSSINIPKIMLSMYEIISNKNNSPSAIGPDNSNHVTESLGPTTGKGFQRKLLEYLKTKAKLTSLSTIDLLNQTIHRIKSINNLQEQQVPEEIIPLFKISYPDYFWRGKQLPLITSQINGRTGNIMGEYATLLALKRLYNVSVLIHPDMKKALSKDFPHLSLNETVSDDDLNNSSLWHSIANEGGTFMYGTFELAAAGLLGPKMFIFGGYSFEVQLWKYYYEDLKKDFRFSTELKKQADEFLLSICNNTGIFSKNIVFIGFHVRRTDYSNHMHVLFNATLPGNTYFKLALNYYRKKFEHPVFIAASDDTTYLQNSIIAKQKDVYISAGKSAAEDMAILASCNHSIMTLGTYGFWGGYLAGGEVVYPVDTSYKTPYRLNGRTLQELKLPNFTPITY